MESPRMDLKTLEVWFVTGSQHLYGEAALRQVAENSRSVVEGLNASGSPAAPRDLQADRHHAAVDPGCLPRGQRGGPLRA